MAQLSELCLFGPFKVAQLSELCLGKRWGSHPARPDHPRAPRSPRTGPRPAALLTRLSTPAWHRYLAAAPLIALAIPALLDARPLWADPTLRRNPPPALVIGAAITAAAALGIVAIA